jgi:hypothetical protein
MPKEFHQYISNKYTDCLCIYYLNELIGEPKNSTEMSAVLD